MQISVVLCTYNNCTSLNKTLCELQEAIKDYTDIEIIIVNNNSNDETENVCQKFAEHPKFQYLLQEKQGLSHARNLGVEKAKGEYILFTDDDAVIPPDWLSIYVNNIKLHSPDALFGPIHVHWDQPKPDWYLDEYKYQFAHLNYGSTDIWVQDTFKEFYGKNFAVRKKLLIGFGGFNPELGRIGDKLISGEETEIFLKLIENHNSVLYQANAGVGHRLKNREYTFDNMKKMYRDSAIKIYVFMQRKSKKMIFGRPAFLVKEVMLGGLKSIISMIFCFSEKKRKKRILELNKYIALSKLLWEGKNNGL